MSNIIVFDLGGTLMEYIGMPLDWSEYYYEGFAKVNNILGLHVLEKQLHKSVEILKQYNPRISKREYEIAPEIIFSKAIAEWENKPNIEKVIVTFFKGLKLYAKIYNYSIDILKKCKNFGYKIAYLTDLPSGMPDYIFKAEITEIINLCDFYVSSQSCGARKPNKKGLLTIANFFSVDISELLFVGDEEKDYMTACNAGCKFMFIDDFLKTFEWR